MAGKQTLAAALFVDWDPSVRSDIIATQWETGVIDIIEDLMIAPPWQSSQAVLDAIGQTGKSVCHFNPIFELYAAQVRFLPGARRVR
jgi:hypothetical protein